MQICASWCFHNDLFEFRAQAWGSYWNKSFKMEDKIDIRGKDNNLSKWQIS